MDITLVANMTVVVQHEVLLLLGSKLGISLMMFDSSIDAYHWHSINTAIAWLLASHKVAMLEQRVLDH